MPSAYNYSVYDVLPSSYGFTPDQAPHDATHTTTTIPTQVTGGRVCSAYFCYLCQTAGHHFTQCRCYQHDTVCFHSELTDVIYVYQEPWERWVSGAIPMRDIFRFISQNLGLRQHQVELVVGGVVELESGRVKGKILVKIDSDCDQRPKIKVAE